MKSLLLLLFVFAFNFACCQSAAELLEKYTAEFSKPQYLAYNTKYTLYKGKDSKVILESYTGAFRKNPDQDVLITAQQNELLTTPKMSITVSNNEKVIFVEKPRPNSAGEFDINQLLPYFKLSPVVMQGNLFKIVMSSTPVSGLPYNRIEVFLNKKYQVVKQVFYFSTSYNLGDSNKPEYVYPRLEIENTNFSNNRIADSFFKPETYLIFSGKSVSAKQKDYKVYDKRSRQ